MRPAKRGAAAAVPAVRLIRRSHHEVRSSSGRPDQVGEPGCSSPETECRARLRTRSTTLGSSSGASVASQRSGWSRMRSAIPAYAHRVEVKRASLITESGMPAVTRNPAAPHPRSTDRADLDRRSVRSADGGIGGRRQWAESEWPARCLWGTRSRPGPPPGCSMGGAERRPPSPPSFVEAVERGHAVLVVVITIVLGVAVVGLRSAPARTTRRTRADREVRMPRIRAGEGPTCENGVPACSR